MSLIKQPFNTKKYRGERSGGLSLRYAFPTLDLPLTTSIVPQVGSASPTFTRATTATVVDFEGLVKTVKSGEARFVGARRVENLATNPEGVGGVAPTLPSGWQQVSQRSIFSLVGVGIGYINIRVKNDSGLSSGYNQCIFVNSWDSPSFNITLGDKHRLSFDCTLISGTPVDCNIKSEGEKASDSTFSEAAGYSIFTPTLATKRVSCLSVIGNSLTTSIRCFFGTSSSVPTGTDFTVRLSRVMVEKVTGQANQNPSEYVSNGVLSAPYHGAGVDGVKYFPTYNGNTVTNNIVTVIQGAPIPEATLEGYLSEGSGTNLCLYSNDVGNASAWTTTGSVVAGPIITSNNATSPDGSMTASRIDLPAVVGASAYSRTLQGATSRTCSVYLKGAVGGEVVYLHESNDGITFTKTVCTLTTSWQRFSLSKAASGVTSWRIGVDLRDATQSAQPAQTIYAWGAQIGVSAFPTSLIPTTTASATRNADVLSYPISSTTPISITCLYLKGTNLGGAISLNPVSVGAYASMGAGANWYANGMGYFNAGYKKRGIILSGTSIKAYESGVLSGQSNSSDFAGGCTSIKIGLENNAPLFGTMKNVKIWSTALSDNQMRRVTI